MLGMYYKQLDAMLQTTTTRTTTTNKNNDGGQIHHNSGQGSKQREILYVYDVCCRQA